MKIGIISQARMTSTRLPGKVLKKINGKTVLEYHIDRLKDCNAELIIATTVNPTDNPIISLCEQLNIKSFRGDEQNVLSRYYLCAKENKLDVIIRVTSDCPFLDKDLINNGIELFINNFKENLYLSNCLERSYPRGFDFEIFSFSKLEEAFFQAKENSDLEHVTPYLHQNKGGDMIFKNIKNTPDKSNYRITLDTQNDFDLIEKLILDHQANLKNHHEIIRILDENPDLVKININEVQKSF